MVGTLRRLGYRGTIVLHLQNDHPGHWTSEMLDTLARQVDAVAVCSTYIGEQFCPKSKALAAKTQLIFNGVNVEQFYPNEGSREPKTIFFVGSFIPQKGALELVKAYVRVLDSHPDAKLVIGGSLTFGINKETPYILEVRKLADAIRQEKGGRIQFPGFHSPRQGTASLVSESHHLQQPIAFSGAIWFGERGSYGVCYSGCRIKSRRNSRGGGRRRSDD
jgi:glycosyltransferase involved in cell wall biosynthesis